MDRTTDALIKLANETIASLDKVERENADLKAKLAKQASASQAVPTDKAVNAAVESLVKCGALKKEQSDSITQAFKQDPDAALRAISGLVDAQLQVKTASGNSNVTGGKLQGETQTKSASYSELPDRLMTILNN